MVKNNGWVKIQIWIVLNSRRSRVCLIHLLWLLLRCIVIVHLKCRANNHHIVYTNGYFSYTKTYSMGKNCAELNRKPMRSEDLIAFLCMFLETHTVFQTLRMHFQFLCVMSMSIEHNTMIHLKSTQLNYEFKHLMDSHDCITKPYEMGYRFICYLLKHLLQFSICLKLREVFAYLHTNCDRHLNVDRINLKWKREGNKSPHI